jgi:hypothetical protein
LSTTKKDADPIEGALPLKGTKYWIARSTAPGADRVGPDFVLAPFPRRAESEPQVTSVPAAEPHPKPRARRGTGQRAGKEAA